MGFTFVACALIVVGCASTAGPASDRAPSAPAGVLVDDHVITYPIRGRTVAEVRRALASAAPEATRSGAYGEDNSTVSWRWNARAAVAVGCELRDVTVTVSNTITVPTWVADSTAEPGLADQWATFDAALRRHERGHEAITFRMAGTLAQSLRHVRAARCADAAAAGNQLGAEALAALRTAQHQYDDSTGHGRTQGAIWPPHRTVQPATTPVSPTIPTSPRSPVAPPAEERPK